MNLVIPDLTAPPPAFGIGWVALSPAAGEEPAWVAPTTPVFVEAWRTNTPFLEVRGYRVDDRRAPASVTWRRRDLGQVSPSAAADPMRGIRRVEEGARLHLQRDAEYRAARTPRHPHESGLVRRELRDILARARWAIPRRHLQAAADLGAAEALTPRQHSYADDIVAQAQARFSAMSDRMCTPLGRICVAIAEREGAAEVIMEALRYISGLDGDRASERNGRGWDAAATELGHSFSEQDWIGWPERGAALVLVHRHRGQLPEDLRRRLFLYEEGALSAATPDLTSITIMPATA